MIDRGALVVDASVALSIVRKEPAGTVAAAAIVRWTTNGARVVVPVHFWMEVANSLLRRHKWTGAEVLQAIHDLDEMHLQTIEVDRPMIVLAIDLSERHGLTTYDAAYLAVATSMDASLATLDTALRAAAGPRAIQIGPPRLSETAAIYEYAVTWPNYKGASAYLAQLRAEAARPA